MNANRPDNQAAITPVARKAQATVAAVLAAVCALCAVGGHARAETIEIGPSVAGPDCVEEFEELANRLKPGDRLVLRGGRYEQSCRRAIRLQGTESEPITIEAAPGEVPILAQPQRNLTTENNLEIIDARHVVIRGLVFEGGSIGVRLLGETHQFELAHTVIRGTGNTAFAANVGNSSKLNLHHNEIHDTGNADRTEGEGLYLGCHDRRCQVTDSRIEHNTLYRLRGSSAGGNDGIEIKPGSGGNRVAYNRITGNRDSADFPCITAYGGAEENTIENNLLIDCSVGVHAIRDAWIVGNVIKKPQNSAITVKRHRTMGAPSNVHVLNNTVEVDATGGAGMSLWLWGARTIVIANNAIFADQSTAVRGVRLRNAEFASNWVSGRLKGVPLSREGIRILPRGIPHRAVAVGPTRYRLEFEDAGAAITGLEGRADLLGTERPQGLALDVGAIERTGSQAGSE